MLSHYYSLMGWADGLANAGAQVTVFQRYRRDVTLYNEGIPYHFIAEYDDNLRYWQIPWRINRQVQALCRQNLLENIPTIVQMNGFVFPLSTRALRFMLPRTVPLVIQHHGAVPAQGWRGLVQKLTLHGLDGYLFAASELANGWIKAGVIDSTEDVYQVMETSTLFSYQDRQSARKISGMAGQPILFWAGNLDNNKDPLTILEGFERLLWSFPDARLYMAYRRQSILAEVEALIANSSLLSRSVTILGRLSRLEIPYYFNSADLFVQGSSKEGSGIALLDALACGTIPVVTDIPSFRTILGNGVVGALWPPGDVDGYVAALHRVLDQPLAQQTRAAIDLFEEKWSFSAVGREALRTFQEIWEKQNTKAF